MFYHEIVSYILLNPGMTQRIDISREIRQGCPISPQLFILCTQLLAYLVLNQPDFKGIDILGYELKISQFADDTVIFLKDKSVIEKALNIISTFSKASGLHLNLKKCELLPLLPCNATQILSIPVKNWVKYLGVKLTNDEKARGKSNIDNKIESVNKSFNHWLMRDTTIFGRNFLTPFMSPLVRLKKLIPSFIISSGEIKHVMSKSRSWSKRAIKED